MAAPDGSGSEYFAFLASRHAGEYSDVRRAIKDLGGEFGLPIWVAEDRPELQPALGQHQLEIVDACIAAIAQSRTLIAVVDGSLGTNLEPFGRTLAASYLELELFQAALRGMAVHVFAIGRIDSQSPTGRLLEILKFAYPETIRTNVDSATEVLSEIRPLFGREAVRKSGPRRSARRSQRLIGALGQSRHFDWTNDRLGQEIHFLGGNFSTGHRAPDLDAVESLLSDAEHAANSDRKITRGWMAIRELMAVPYGDTSDPRVLALWDRALGRWASWSAWRGMHAHLFLGHPAALGSLSEVRKRLEAAGMLPADTDGHTASLSGAFASCYYSLSKIAPGGHRLSYLARAERYVEEGLSRGQAGTAAGLYCMSGSIALQRGDAAGAIKRYQTALEIRERASTDAATVGETRAELGWAQVRAGATRIGVANLREGVRQMTGAHQAGFVVRGKKKLALGLATRLDLRGTLRELMEARDMALDHQLEGQMDTVLRLGGRLGDILEDVGIRITRRVAD